MKSMIKKIAAASLFALSLAACARPPCGTDQVLSKWSVTEALPGDRAVAYADGCSMKILTAAGGRVRVSSTSQLAPAGTKPLHAEAQFAVAKCPSPGTAGLFGIEIRDGDKLLSSATTPDLLGTLAVDAAAPASATVSFYVTAAQPCETDLKRVRTWR